MFSADLVAEAELLLARWRTRGLRLATAESCTGGLIAALFTEVPGASDVFERGFVTYSNAAKIGALGVRYDILARHGAVSAEVAVAMAAGAIGASAADIAVSVTGIAGPSGGTAAKPVGLVFIGYAIKDGTAASREYRFGDQGRSAIRAATVRETLKLLDTETA
jgi:nicotinamide-nucleotide amidase